MFIGGDDVIFDDNATSTNVVVTGGVSPKSITFNNDTKTFTLSGDSIIGKTGLTKKLTENKEALPAGFNQQRFILNCITVIQDMMKDNKKKEQLEKVQLITLILSCHALLYRVLSFWLL